MRRKSKKWGIFLKIAFASFSMVLTLAGLEFASSILVKYPKARELFGSSWFYLVPVRNSIRPIPYDRNRVEISGLTKTAVNNYTTYLEPNQKTVETAKDHITGKIIYESQVTIDEYGRRVTPQSHLDKRDKHLVFLGCSFTFGSGVNDDETLPSVVSKLAPTYHSYNLGVPGSGANGVLARLQMTGSLYGIREQKGIAFYSFIPDHVGRTIGRMSLVSTWTATAPAFEEDDNGELYMAGSFESSYPLMVSFYRFFWNTNFRSLFRIDLPPMTESKVSFFVRVVAQIKKEYQNKFGPNEFYFVIFPPPPEFRHMEFLKEELDRLQIKYLDYSKVDLATLTDKDYRFPYEGHPTAEAYRIIGEMIVKDLGLQ